MGDELSRSRRDLPVVLNSRTARSPLRRLRVAAKSQGINNCPSNEGVDSSDTVDSSADPPTPWWNHVESWNRFLLEFNIITTLDFQNRAVTGITSGHRPKKVDDSGSIGVG